MINLSNIKGVTLTSLKQRVFTITGLGTKGDVRTPNECAPAGVDCPPLVGDVAVHANTVSIGGSVTLGVINTNQLANPGERRVYATDADGNEASRIWQHNNGDIELGGTGPAGSNVNHATQWEALNAQIATWKSLLDTQLTTIAAAAGTTYTAPPLDISTAKLTKIKTE